MGWQSRSPRFHELTIAQLFVSPPGNAGYNPPMPDVNKHTLILQLFMSKQDIHVLPCLLIEGSSCGKVDCLQPEYLARKVLHLCRKSYLASRFLPFKL